MYCNAAGLTGRIIVATVFLTLQGKGGIGKSYASSTLAQYLIARERAVKCMDTDPNNATFAAFKALSVQKVVITDGASINPRTFDDLIQQIAESGSDDYFVVDNGSPSFIPMMSYLIENGVLELLAEYDHQVYFNVVIAGGPDTQETMTCFDSMMSQTKAGALVWFNAYFGPLTYLKKAAEDHVVYQYGDRIIGTVRLQKLMEQTFGQDVREMLEKRLTFDEAIAAFNLMPSTRIKRLQTNLWDQLDAIFTGTEQRHGRSPQKDRA